MSDFINKQSEPDNLVSLPVEDEMHEEEDHLQKCFGENSLVYL